LYVLAVTNLVWRSPLASLASLVIGHPNSAPDGRH
jgi:hypothetical protein